MLRSASWVTLEAASFRRLRPPAPTSRVAAAVMTAQVTPTEPPMEPRCPRGSQMHPLRPFQCCRQDLASALDARACASGERGTPSPPTPTAISAPPAKASESAERKSFRREGYIHTDGEVYEHELDNGRSNCLSHSLFIAHIEHEWRAVWCMCVLPKQIINAYTFNQQHALFSTTDHRA